MRLTTTMAAIGVSIALAACASTPAIKTACLPLKPYTAAQQAALAAELQALADGDPVAMALADYGAMRAADRACIAARP